MDLVEFNGVLRITEKVSDQLLNNLDSDDHYRPSGNVPCNGNNIIKETFNLLCYSSHWLYQCKSSRCEDDRRSKAEQILLVAPGKDQPIFPLEPGVIVREFDRRSSSIFRTISVLLRQMQASLA
jgi:hypothetical protein